MQRALETLSVDECRRVIAFMHDKFCKITVSVEPATGGALVEDGQRVA